MPEKGSPALGDEQLKDHIMSNNDYLHKYSVGHIITEGPATPQHYLQIFYGHKGNIEKKILDGQPTTTIELEKHFGTSYMLKVYERCHKRGVEQDFTIKPRESKMTTSGKLEDAPHSAHYKQDDGIEPIEFIEANDLGFHLGNVVKYTHRVRHPKEGEDPVKCIDKLIWYAERKRSLIIAEQDKQLKAT